MTIVTPVTGCGNALSRRRRANARHMIRLALGYRSSWEGSPLHVTSPSTIHRFWSLLHDQL
jgi:hypothetical protein